MKAIQAIKDDRFYFEARAIMDRHNLPDDAFETVYAERKHRAFMEEIAPYQKQIVSIMACAAPTRYITRFGKDGHIQEITKDGGTFDSVRDLVAPWQAQIDEIQQRYYGARNLPPSS